ncbi:MAG: site-specific DNA-methyltransferase, partial [Armatimonadetes bacterium]|nr:site-specific DNA-methyltransferase [Armatimonadota bacterium]
SREKTFHACQIPQKLAEMLILSCTRPGDTVFVLFGGSGSEVEICRRLGRNFLSAEIDPKYHEMILRRLQVGHIEEQYRLMLRKTDDGAQLALPVDGEP